MTRSAPTPAHDAGTPLDDETREALEALAATFTASTGSPDATVAEIDEIPDDDAPLPPPELPAEYLATDRESLTESDAYSAHLNEHWGF